MAGLMRYAAATAHRSTARTHGSWLRRSFPTEPSPGEMRHLHAYAQSFVDRHFSRLDRLIEQLRGRD